MAGSVKLLTPSSGSVLISPTDTASTVTLTLPSSNDTLTTNTATQILTNKTLTNPVINGFTGDTSVINIGSGQIYKDTNGNVGIGTSSPYAGIDLYKYKTSWSPDIYPYPTGNVFLAAQAVSGGTNWIGIKGVYGASSGSANLMLQPTYNDMGQGAGNYIGSEASSLATTALTFGRLVGGGTLGTNATKTEYMRLDSSGNLGLGVTPNTWVTGEYAFQIGTLASLTSRSFGSGNRQVSIYNNAYINSSGTSTYLISDAASLYRQNAGYHFWFTAPSGTAGNPITFTQAMTLDASGNLSLATTSAQGSCLLSLGVSGRNANGLFIGGYSNNNMLVLDSTYNQSAAVRFVRGGVLVGNISFTDAGTVYSTSSDQRLKENIAPAGSAIQSILDFPVDQFDWISTGEHQDFGAVAQKAYKVIPEMVSIPANEEEMWGIDWSKAVPRLIKTIQEISAKNSELESRLAALENK